MSKLIPRPYFEDESLDHYLQQIGAVPLLTAEEEIGLARRIKQGDEEALEQLTRANLRFVVSVAKQYQHYGLPLSDLINEGNLGLIRAAKKFDETKGFKFISYAVWWIRQGILQALAEQSRIVRLPLNRLGTLRKIGRVSNDLEQVYGRPPSPDEIADELEISADEVRGTLQAAAHPLSLDTPFGDEGDHNLLDLLKDEAQTSPDEDVIYDSLRREIEKALSTLSEREAEIIRLYFGTDGQKEPMTLEQIGEKFGLTRERVRQIKEKALRRLRHTSRSRPLRTYLS